MGRESEPAVAVSGVCKRYGDRLAVNDVSFTVERGEVLALLGPNGAGKTTTVEILEGYRRPDAGTVWVLGLDPHRDGARLKPRIGLMLQEGGIYPAIRPLEALQLFASFYPRPANPRAVLRQVGLEAVVGTRYRHLSGGQKQRLALGLALIGQPELVFLDEPTAGMDPQARLATWQIIRSLRQQGVTILLTTHAMDEAERLADRVAILDGGRLLALDRPAVLMQEGSARHVRFWACPDLDTARLAAEVGVETVREEAPGVYSVAAEVTPDLVASLTRWLAAQGVLLQQLQVARQSLEEVFLRLTGQEYRD